MSCKNMVTRMKYYNSIEFGNKAANSVGDNSAGGLREVLFPLRTLFLLQMPEAQAPFMSLSCFSMTALWNGPSLLSGRLLFTPHFLLVALLEFPALLESFAAGWH